MKPFKVLIFVVAYNAERTLSRVLERIPDELFDRRPGACDCEILVIDDGSNDATVAAGMRTLTFRHRPVTILRNPVKLGYGGNQKVGFHYAIKNGFDAVALLHGDGQYAPERLPELLTPLACGEAEAVIGSRMLEKGAARRGGMPLVKRIGHRLLTAMQNRIVGTHLSDYHSGYRLYACRALAALPFESNGNGFDFDTDIILQLHRSGARIRELTVPTFTSDDIRHLGGVAHAWRTLRACLHNRLYDLGLFYQRKFDVEGGHAHYRAKTDFFSSHSMAAERVGAGERVLDLGCGPGCVGAVLRARGAYVVGVDQILSDETRAACDVGVEADLNAFDWSRIAPLGPFDKVLALDIIEHLRNAEDFVQEMRKEPVLAGAEILLCVPNVAFLPVRLMLLFGRFNHGKRGILDRTHTRLYTFQSIGALLEQNGYEVLEVRGVPAPFPLALGRTALARMLLAVNRAMIVCLRSLFSYQIFCRLRAKPSLDVLLSRAEDEGARARNSVELR